MESEKIKWISITILGLAVISFAGVGGLMLIDQSQNTDKFSNDPDEEVQSITEGEAEEIVRDTESYKTLAGATTSDLSINSIKLTKSNLSTAKDGNSDSNTGRGLYNLLSSELIKDQPGYIITATKGSSSGYFYQVSNEGEVISRWGADEYREVVGDRQERSYSGYVDSRCTKSSSGFSTADVRIVDFALTSDSKLAFELRNAALDPIEITSVKVETGQKSWSAGKNLQLNVGEVGTYTGTLWAEESESCNDLDVEITYDRGSIEDMVATGTITSEIELN